MTPESPSATARAPNPEPRRRSLWVPALLSSLILAMVIGGIAVGHFHWQGLRSSLTRMDQTMEHARSRQQQMMEHFSQAQGLLMAQQRHLSEIDEGLRAREAALSVQREAMAQAMLSWRSVANQTEVRGLAHRLDLDLAALGDPGALEAVSGTLDALAQWTAGLPLSGGQETAAGLHQALAEAGAGLAVARDPAHLAERLGRLGTLANGLAPAGDRPSARGKSAQCTLAAQAWAGHLGEQIQTALFALRRGDEALYRLALDTALAWLAAFYDPGQPQVSAVSAELAALRRLPMQQDLSGLRSGLTRLRAILGESIETAAGRTDPKPGTGTD